MLHGTGRPRSFVRSVSPSRRPESSGAAYFDIRFNAKVHSLPASRSPSLASPIITLAIAIVAQRRIFQHPCYP
jgi:hypothetical protein